MNDVSLICTCIRKSFNVNRLDNQDIFGLSYLLGLEPRLSIPLFDLKFCLSPNLETNLQRESVSLRESHIGRL